MPVRLGLVLTSAGADHPLCSAAFCSTRLCRHYFALAGFALSRRHRSAARPALGHHHECVDDQFLRRFLSLFHLPDLLVARADFAIYPDWNGRWSRTRFIRFDIDPLGKPPGRILLHAQPLARPSHHAGNRSTSYLRMVAHHASQRSQRSTLALVGVRNPTFCRSRSRLDRLLFGLRNRSTYSNHAPRETAPWLKRRLQDRDFTFAERKSVASAGTACLGNAAYCQVAPRFRFPFPRGQARCWRTVLDIIFRCAQETRRRVRGRDA
jgi:hypothetical protein